MQISDAQIVALGVALAPFLVALSTLLYKSYLARLPQNKQAMLMSLAHTAVQAAEQVGSGATGATRKKIAEDAVNAALKSLGLNVAPAFARPRRERASSWSSKMTPPPASLSLRC